jgi:outer membrane biosynthesis protein TonB
VRAGRFGELDHSELIHLLDSLDDERARARFRESVYISLFFWMAVVGVLLFAPRIFPNQPRFVTPIGESKNKEITSLSVPRDLQRSLERAPKASPAPKAPAETKTPEPPRQQALPNAPKPQPERPQTTQQPAPQQAAPPPPQQQVQQPLLPQPRPTPAQQTSALPSAPAPSATAGRPDFGNPNTSARDMVQQAGRAPRGGGGLTTGGGGGVEHRGLGTGVDVLSDMQGVDFNPYLQKIMREIYETWLPLIPEEARPPLNKQGETQIRFIILPDGRIGGMALEGSTHDDAINKSCWGSITGVGQFPALPSQFHGPNLELRIHYLVNKEPR